jgi:hypothetical protein
MQIKSKLNLKFNTLPQKNIDFWDVTMCSPVEDHDSEENTTSHLEGLRVSQAINQNGGGNKQSFDPENGGSSPPPTQFG